MILKQEAIDNEIKVLEQELEKVKQEKYAIDQHNKEIRKQLRPTIPLDMKMFEIKGKIAKLKEI